MEPNKHILLVEDDAFLSQLLSKKLKENLYNITILDRGTDVFSLINQEKPDILIMDILLPDKSGLQIAEEIKKTDSLQDLPIILLSNLEDEETRKKAASVAKVLIKSEITLDEILKAIKEAIK